jgi:hypothetical protein
MVLEEHTEAFTDDELIVNDHNPYFLRSWLHTLNA